MRRLPVSPPPRPLRMDSSWPGQLPYGEGTEKNETKSGTQFECRFPDPAWSNASVAISLAFESIAKGNRFKFDPDSVHDGNHGSCLKFKCR